ncbi:MAG: S8 family serine peptidase [Acidimicrobiia bacterium]
MRRFALVLSFALVAASAPILSTVASAAPPNAAPPAVEPAAVPDQLLVGYDIGTSAAERADARGQAGARRLEDVVRGGADRRAVELVALPSGSDRGAAIRRFEQNPNVAYAEPNWIVTHQSETNDPYYTGNQLWGMYGDGTSPANQYGSQAGEAWAAGNTGSDSVVVGVIDEGIDISHPDLATNIWVNPGEVAGNRVDDDQNGFVDDVNGWDFANNDASVYDGTGDDHGTHVAGTIAGIGGNEQGVAGVAWNAKLISAKFLGPNGGYTDDAVQAVDYLTDLKKRGVNVVASNNSWGGGGYSQALYDAIGRANTAGVLFVAAAGNGGRDQVGDNNDATPHYPSSYTNANIIAVASITSSGGRSSFSNYGATSVDLGAPGSGIVSTLPDGKYGSYSGTSMATPHVTGGIILAATQSPLLDPAGLRNAILLKATPTDGLEGNTVTGGRLDVSTFGGNTKSGNTPPAADPESYTTPQGSTLTVPAPGVLDGDHDPDGDRLSASIQTLPTSGTLTLKADGSFTYKPNRKFTGTDSFTYTADDGRGGTATATVTITVVASTTKRR